MTIQGNIINMIEYYMSYFEDKFIFDNNMVSIFHKYQLLNDKVGIINE